MAYIVLLKNMKHILTLSLILLIILRASAGDKLWRPKDYAHCVAYTYACKMDKRGYDIVFDDGSIHKGIIRSGSLTLAEQQTERMLALLNTKKDNQEECDCHEPDHALVFYDVRWKPVGWVTIAFLCQNICADPDDLSLDVDIEGLEKYCKSIGMPVLPDQESYTKLFLKEQSPEARKQILKERSDEEAARIEDAKAATKEAIERAQREKDEGYIDPFAEIPEAE
jgi:hypothetical protein